MNKTAASLVMAALAAVAAGPKPAPQDIPGGAFQPPAMPEAAGAPVIYEHSAEAGPDETFFVVGEKLSTNLVAWGVSDKNTAGQPWQPRAQFLTGGYLAATLPERAHDGPFVVWVKNSAGCSAPMVLNAPQPWWCFPNAAAPNESVRLFGRNLARRPDGVEAFVYLARAGRAGVWVDVDEADKHSVTFSVPEGLAPGNYQVWVHAGAGGEFGWGEPVKLRVTVPTADKEPAVTELPEVVEIQRALDAAARRGGGVVKLPEGTFQFGGTLRIPAGVTLSGADMDKTKLQLIQDPNAVFARLGDSGWNHAPGAVHTPGDSMEYAFDVPQAGPWTVWLRYATDMTPWKQPGVSGNHVLIVDAGEPVPLENLPNTGGFGVFKWAKSATLNLTAGKHKLAWKNVKGGGISLDAFVFAFDPAFDPGVARLECGRGFGAPASATNSQAEVGAPRPLPHSGRDGVVILQAEDCVKFAAKDGSLPGGDRAAVWLNGDGAGVENLTILGNAQVNIGVAIRSPEPLAWLSGCRVEKVRIADCDGKQAENCGVLATRVERATVADNELWGRTPLFISGARQTGFARNRLVSVTRFGGNAEAAILGRCEPIEECVIEDNVIVSPRGAESGGPTARRLLWFSTGHGSISRNWIAGNGVEDPRGPGAAVGAGQARFGGVAGTDQNVGETILFEGNHRTAYFGPLAGADGASVTLPKTFPPTPDDRLGSVKREQLAHDADNNETPFWPPDVDDGSPEPPMGEYYVTVFGGVGQGQTRRVVKRDGERLLLDRPWRVAPAKGSVVAVGTMFHRNLIVGNHTPDGMTGIQLWISCVENVIAGNTITRQRKPGLFLYANGTTLASSMPRTWNRGISPLFWNVAEGNRCEECSAGALVTSGDGASLPVEFPRALGNVLRHNTFIRSRTDGVVLVSRKGAAGAGDAAASVTGTVVEFNMVRDAATAYHAAGSSDAVVFRRNHAYFWYPVNNSTNAPVAFAVDEPRATVVIEQNSTEGIHGVGVKGIIEVQRAKEEGR